MPKKNDSSAVVKKGRSTWRPASMLDLPEKEPGFRYRFCDKDPSNLVKKQKEGWIFVNKTTDPYAEHSRPETVVDGKTLTSAIEYREMVLMAMPEETGIERDRYIAEQTDAQTRAIKDRLQEELDDAAGGQGSRVHGRVVIE